MVHGIISTIFIGLGLWSIDATSRIIVQNRIDAQIDVAPPLVEFKPEAISLMFLGHKPLYDDFITAWLVQDIVENQGRPEKRNALDRHIELVTDHLPQLGSIYILSCSVYLARKTPEHCLPIMLKGIKALPDNWIIPVSQGYIYQFVLHDTVKAESFFKMAAALGDAPRYIKDHAEKLASLNVAETLEALRKEGGNDDLVKILGDSAVPLPAPPLDPSTMPLPTPTTLVQPAPTGVPQ